ncbi:hypothetical protein AU210_016431 [Fusarium oxysporum f. sp. radicis-cucumerinum]|uniref:Uncharacterized protein n=1 Tax=Fusarium oxysporum f. sp. radicis-cucumerinum TaxID=327505 RepID=A0A2H3G8R6_FUSOX|nr:hypothetical protein AU210_016431 [Fusarium oxysporum f. sp. radicis-cucumerinum]
MSNLTVFGTENRNERRANTPTTQRDLVRDIKPKGIHADLKYPETMKHLLLLLNISSVYGLCDWYYGHWQPEPHQCFDLVVQELGVSLELIQYMNFDRDLNKISEFNIYNVPLSTKPLKFATWTDDCPPRLVVEKHRTCASSDTKVSKAHQKTADAKTVPSPSSSADVTKIRPTGSIATDIAESSKTLDDASAATSSAERHGASQKQKHRTSDRDQNEADMTSRQTTHSDYPTATGTAKDSEVTKETTTLISTTNVKSKTETRAGSNTGSLSNTETTKKEPKPTTSHGSNSTKSGERSTTAVETSRPSKTTAGASTTTSEGKTKQAATSNTVKDGSSMSRAKGEATTRTDTAKVTTLTTIRTSTTKTPPKATTTNGFPDARNHKCGLVKDFPGHAEVSYADVKYTAGAWCDKDKVQGAIMSAESKKLKAVMKGSRGVLYEYSVRWMENCRWTDQRVSFPLNHDKKTTCVKLMTEFAWEKCTGNEGVGGTAQAGCLLYELRASGGASQGIVYDDGTVIEE